MTRLRTIGFCALLLAVGCDREDCEERLIAAAAVGGPIGLLVAQAASCAAENTAAASPRIAAAYIAAAPTPAPKPAPEPMPAPMPAPMPVTPPPLPPPADSDGDGVPDASDQCRTLAAGVTPSTARPGCPAPVTVIAALPQPVLSGNVVADGEGFTVKAAYDWQAQQPSDGTLSYRFPLPPQAAQAQQIQVFYDVAADLTWGTETAKCAAALGYPGYYIPSPSGRPTDYACVRPGVTAPNYTAGAVSQWRLGGPGASGTSIPVSTQMYTLAVRFRGDVAVTQPEGNVSFRLIF